MDRIDGFILKNMHKTNNSQIVDKTWKDFEDACKNKKLIIYGMGPLLIYLQIRLNCDIVITAAIDNDVNKQNRPLSIFFDVSDFKDSANVIISSKKILENYNPNEVVILISSHRFYEQIASELDSKNFHCYFSILNMEYNYREQMKKQNLKFETEYTYIEKYSKECVKKYPVDLNKILIYMAGYLDHGKYITKELLKLNKSFDIVWVIDDPTLKVPEGVRIVYEKNLKRYIYELETAKIWIYNLVFLFPVIKRKQQIYIHTKHWGSITLKKFSLESPQNVDIEGIKNHGKLMDYIISGSDLDEESCRKGFNFQGQFLRFGSPRSDILFKPKECVKKIYNLFNLSDDEHIVMYAPTFRVHKEKGIFIFKWQGLNFDNLLYSLKKKWGSSWKIFLRLHPTVKIHSNKIERPDYVIDVSNYDDSQELVAASDILISDFSSIIFEQAYVLKPVFLYAPDKDTYERDDRELLLDYNSLPFPISTTNEELSKQIINFDEKKYKKSVKEFLDKYGVHEDGHASERAAKFILDLIYPQKD